MKTKLLISFIAFLVSFNCVRSQEVSFLNKESFKAKVWDYQANSTWKYKDNKPAIIDFYADWAKPCSMIAPHLTAIQKEYGSKLQVYKINIEKNPELANLFKVRTVPTLLLIPSDGNYKKIVSYRNKQQLDELVKSVLKIEK